MGNYVLTLHHERCPDGAEFAPHPWVEGTTINFPSKNERMNLRTEFGGFPKIRFRSERREDYRLRLETPDKLIVTEYITNTLPVSGSRRESDLLWGSIETELQCDYSGLINFVSEYGFPSQNVRFMRKLRNDVESLKKQGLSDWDSKFYSETEPFDASLRMFVHHRNVIHAIWRSYENGDLHTAVMLFRDASDIIESLSPDLELRNGKPALTLPIRSLYNFMLMETALVITGGSQVMRCSKCGTIFVTGSGTGRRGSSLYCSNRCRVAAQRSRMAEPTSFAEPVMTDLEKLENIAAAVRRNVGE
jgi:hypothetical protein